MNSYYLDLVHLIHTCNLDHSLLPQDLAQVCTDDFFKLLFKYFILIKF